MSNKILGFPCIGGKNALLPKLKLIIEYCADNYHLKCFGDFCGGGGKVVLGINPFKFKLIFYNEIEFGLSNLMACLKNPVSTNCLIRLIYKLVNESNNPKNLFSTALALKDRKETDIITSAAYTLITIYGSFLANRMSFSIENFDKYFIINRNYINLHKYNEALINVKIFNEDCLDMIGRLKNYDNILAFIDCPYVPDVMEGNHHYINSWTSKDHEKLIKLLLDDNMHMKWILCGYKNDIYRQLEQSGICRCYYIDTVPISSGANKGSVDSKDEYIWTNMVVHPSLINN